MKTFYYFSTGEFSPVQYGYNYERNQKFFEVYAETYDDAYQAVYMKCAEIYGLQQYTDMWYGLEAHNWKIEPHTKQIFNTLTKNKNIETIWQE